MPDPTPGFVNSIPAPAPTGRRGPHPDTITVNGEDAALAKQERAPDQLAKSMPEWQHTHDLVFRRRTFPVMSKVWMGMQLMFRADGMVEWIRHPVAGWALRGVWVNGVSLSSIAFKEGKTHNPDFLPAPIDALPAAPVACSHTFRDSKTCNKCGVHVDALRAEMQRELAELTR